MTLLKTYADLDHSNYDAFVCCILSHGQSSKFADFCVLFKILYYIYHKILIVSLLFPYAKIVKFGKEAYN